MVQLLNRCYFFSLDTYDDIDFFSNLIGQTFDIAIKLPGVLFGAFVTQGI